MRTLTYFFILISCLYLSGCKFHAEHRANNVENFEIIDAGPLPPPINFGVVIAYKKEVDTISSVFQNREVYQLLRDVILPEGRCSQANKMKLLNLTISDINKFNRIGSITKYCSIQDSVDFFSNRDTADYLLDCSQLPNTICISIAEYLKIFDGHDIDKSWVEFREKYGDYGLHYFSIPVFNKTKMKAIMVVGGGGSSRIGSKELLILERKANRWHVKKEITLEIH